MAMHVQPATMSLTALLPRLLPAPQAFLQTERPWRLPGATWARVVGVESGNLNPVLNYFAHLLHDIDEQPRFSIKVITITGLQTKAVSLRRFGPMNLLSILGMLFSAGLLIAAVVYHDGMAVIAISLLSVTSSFVGLGSLWKVDFQRRIVKRDIPNADVVVIGKQPAFLIVHCTEEVARELYFGETRCEYFVGNRAFQLLSAAATLTFMASVVFLANCTWNLQVGVGIAYVILNGLYWVAGVIPARFQWDLGAYRVHHHPESTTPAANYTQFLIEASKITKSTRWMKTGSVAPKTDAWNMWLDEAESNVDNEKWNGQQALTDFLKQLPSRPSNIGTVV